MIIQYKNNDVFRGMFTKSWHPRLIELYLWLVDMYPDRILITEAYDDRGYNSLHSVDPLRALDIRSRLFKEPKIIENEINAFWVYDFERPDMDVALLHDVGRGVHFHLQVHDNTIKRGAL